MSKKTLNQANLERLGPTRLAALLMEVSAGSADIKRRLRLELSYHLGTEELAHEVRKRLVSLRKSKSYIGWRKRKGLIQDLATQAAMIIDKIAPEDPETAFDLLWQFTELAPFIYGRVDDSKGDVGAVFNDAFQAFTDVGPRAGQDIDLLVDRIWAALLDNEYGAWDGLITVMAPTLEPAGLAKLAATIETYRDTPTQDSETDHAALQFLRDLRGGDSYVADRKAQFVKSCLQEIAALAGDADAYIAQYSATELQRKDIAAEVALILLEQDRPEAALETLLDAEEDGRRIGEAAWDAAYIASLLALGRETDAQDHRWTCFIETLNPAHLRDYLKLLPDFEDVATEDKAKAHVLAFPHFATALRFTLHWPDLVTAAQLIDTRGSEIASISQVLVEQTSEALRARYPLSCVRLWRAKIDAILGENLTSGYSVAAQYLTECRAIDAEIADYGGLSPHADYLASLQEKYGHKAAFWVKVG